MKKRIDLLALCMCALTWACIPACFVSCSDGKDDIIPNEPKPAETAGIENFTQSNMSFTEGAGSESFTFKANSAWTASVSTSGGDTSWCTVSPASGAAGSQTVTVTTQENTGYDDRSATITVKAGATTKTFTVTQKQKNAILLTSDKVEVAQEGSSFTVEVKANVAYKVSIDESCKDWINEGSKATRGLSTTTKTFAVALNESKEKREGKITFTDGALSETVHVYQAGGDIILLSADECYVNAAGEDITVELRNNCDYDVVMPKVDWIKKTESRAMSSHTLYYTVLANEGYDSRSAKIVYRNKDKSAADTLTVTQAQKNAIVLSEKKISVGCEEETFEVKLAANVDFEVTMPKDADWITAVESRALTEHTLYYKVAKNGSDNMRTAEIVFSNKENGLEETLTVTQGPHMVTFTLKAAGTLSEMLDRKDYKSLKLVGEINGSDFLTLRGMKDVITFLDLSEAKIVSGGKEYHRDHIREPYYTADNEIGGYTFYDFRKLEKIILPKSITRIGKYAFASSGMSSGGGNSNEMKLKEIEIPNTVTSIGDHAFSYCSSLTSVAIPNSVTSIGRGAFSSCYSLTSVVIPDSVTSIEAETFYGCI